MERATLSSKFQIVIPKQIREAMGLEPGQTFLFIPKGHVINLVPQRDPGTLRGWLKGANPDDYRDRADR